VGRRLQRTLEKLSAGLARGLVPHLSGTTQDLGSDVTRRAALGDYLRVVGLQRRIRIVPIQDLPKPAFLHRVLPAGGNEFKDRDQERV